ncbi:MAG TPA: DUF4349 domain-containing protein [Anaerolineales bacterium]|nr:DUF4349 domain-containing protein [Anaerolineales bacterium]
MKRLLLISLILTSLILSGCDVAAAPTAAPQRGAPSFSGGAPEIEAPAPTAAPAAAQAQAFSNGASATGGGTSADTERLVVQTAELTIVVQDVKARVSQLEQMANTMGGYVVSVSIGQTYAPDGTQVPDAQMVFRVPANQLDAALNQVKQNTVDVQDETLTGQDITSQYVDLQSRLTAKEAAADQLTKIMQGATRTQDVLDVYQQLQQVDSDIEVLKGQIQYDQEAAQLSAITVHVVAEQTIQPIQVGGWKPQGVARDAIQNLVDFWQWFANVLINFFLLILPALITMAIPLVIAFLILRWLYRWILKRKPKVETPKP